MTENFLGLSYGGWTAASTVVLTVATIGLGTFTYLLWRATVGLMRGAEAQAADLKKSVDAAISSAAATRDLANAAHATSEISAQQAKAVIAVDRAYVFFLDSMLIKVGTQSAYGVSWKNFGRTPAIVTGIKLGCIGSETPPDPATAPEALIPSGAVIGVEQTWQRGAVREQDCSEPFQRGELVYLYGQISYRDVHGIDHRSWFCRLFAGKQFVLDDLTDPKLNGYD